MFLQTKWEMGKVVGIFLLFAKSYLLTCFILYPRPHLENKGNRKP